MIVVTGDVVPGDIAGLITAYLQNDVEGLNAIMQSCGPQYLVAAILTAIDLADPKILPSVAATIRERMDSAP